MDARKMVKANFGRPRKLTNDEEFFILDLLIDNIKLKVPEISDKLYEYRKGKNKDYASYEKKKAKGYDCKDINIGVIEDEIKAEMPGASTITKTAQYLRAQLKKVMAKPPEIDTPWSIGCCIKYQIPADMIQLLLKINKIRNTPLTIRQACWFNKLYLVINSLAEEVFPNSIHNQFVLMNHLVGDYSYLERVAMINEKEIADTSEADKRYFVDKDLAGTLAWINKDLEKEEAQNER